MKYMVIEKFKSGKADEIYERYEQNGRMLPDGLTYLDSWITPDRKMCYQLMETESPELFDRWINNWKDLIDFEIVQVIDSPTKAAR